MHEFTFELEEFWISEDISVFCEIDLIMVEPPQDPSIPSFNDPGEPGWPAVFEISKVRLTADIEKYMQEKLVKQTLIISENDFTTFFPHGQDVVNNAYEWASEQEINYDYY